MDYDCLKAEKLTESVFHDMRDRFDLNRVVEILGKFINVYGIAAIFKSVNSNVLPNVKQGKAFVNADVVCKPEFVDDMKCLTTFNTARAYNSRDHVAAIKTLLGRYLSLTAFMPDDQIPAIVEELNSGLNKFLKYNVGSPTFIATFAVQQDEWNFHFTE